MTTPSTAVGAMWKSRPIVGSATFTIVMSMMFMNMADTNTMPTAIFWFMRGAATFSFITFWSRGGARWPNAGPRSRTCGPKTFCPLPTGIRRPGRGRSGRGTRGRRPSPKSV